MTDDKMLDKVRKLLALAERAGTEAEAIAFTEKANDLILRYAIDEAVLQAKGDKPAEKIITKEVYVKGYVKAKLSLMHRVAEGTGVKAIQYTNDRRGWSEGSGQVVGYESDVAAFEMLFASLQMQAVSEAERSFKQHKANGGYEHGRAFKQSFILGFVVRVGQRLRAQRANTITEVDDSMPGTALAVIDRDKAIANRYAELHPKTGRATVGSRGVSGYGSGYAAGGRANLGNTSIGGGRQALSA